MASEIQPIRQDTLTETIIRDTILWATGQKTAIECRYTKHMCHVITELWKNEDLDSLYQEFAGAYRQQESAVRLICEDVDNFSWARFAVIMAVMCKRAQISQTHSSLIQSYMRIMARWYLNYWAEHQGWDTFLLFYPAKKTSFGLKIFKLCIVLAVLSKVIGIW